MDCVGEGVPTGNHAFLEKQNTGSAGDASGEEETGKKGEGV
jgi:hypothetical protein